MRKALIPEFGTKRGLTTSGSWLDLEGFTTAELSSEDPSYLFERALRMDTVEGWKASRPGPQLIRLRFDHPQSIQRVHLQLQEDTVERSQEITLFATSQTASRKELVRQQWVCGPGGATKEVEDYSFDLKALTVLELESDPGRHDKHVFAALQSIQIG